MHIWFACSAHMSDGTCVMFRTGMELPDATDLLLTTETLEEVEDLCVQHLVTAGHEAAEVHVLSWQEYGGDASPGDSSEQGDTGGGGPG